MKRLLPLLVVLSTAPAAVLAAENQQASCAAQRINWPYQMERVTSASPPGTSSYHDAGIDNWNNNFVARVNSATSSRLAGRSICVPVKERATVPTKMMRVTLGRGVVAWKRVPVKEE